jgi:hypothetical protein
VVIHSRPLHNEQAKGKYCSFGQGSRGPIQSRLVFCCASSRYLGDSGVASDTDLWHFIYDEPTGHWMWKRSSATGQEIAESAFSFASFRVCVADAERAGFNPSTTIVRRVRSSELTTQPDMPRLERRRKPRTFSGESAQ